MLLLATLSVSAQDWANFSRYKEANEKVGLPAKSEKRVVFMGNSITDNWARFRPQFFTENGFVGRGIGGQTTPQMLIRFRADVIDLQPKAVVILAGTNDIAGNTGPSTLKMIEDNLASMTEIAQANGIKVIFISVLPVYEYPWAKQVKDPVGKIAELNAWIKAYAKKKGATYVDCYSAMLDSRKGLDAKYSKDGVHPTPEAYEQVMEPMVLKAINKVLKRK